MTDIGEAEPPSLADRPAVGELTRRMTLARLARAWGLALQGAIRRVDAAGRMAFDAREPPLVAASPAQAFALAGDLAALIDDVIIEGLDWARLDRLAPEAFDPYWRITLDFLKIATSAWPAWLDEQGLVDRAARRRRRRRPRDRGLDERRRARADDHRGLHRHQSRDRAADRRDRARATRARWCCPISTRNSTTRRGR